MIACPDTVKSPETVWSPVSTRSPVIGRSPFDPAEIGQFVDQALPNTVRHTVALSDDPLAAATLAGRSGVSAKRLRRLPLMRDAAKLAGDLADLVSSDRTPRTARHFQSEDAST
jgi:hypothetical protein